MATRARDALTCASTALVASSEGGGLQAFVHRVQICLDVILHRLSETEQCSSQLSHELELILDGIDMTLKQGTQSISYGEEIEQVAQRIRLLGKSPQPSDCVSVVEELSQISETIKRSGQTSVLLSSGLRSALKNAAIRLSEKSAEEAQTIASSSEIAHDAIEKLKSSYGEVTASLSSSATASRQLNLDISQAVVSMQFQDRVNQRIAHLVEAIAELKNDIQPFIAPSDPSKVKSITEFLLNRVSEKSTMESERNPAPVDQSNAADEAFELF
jgi:hypothetical protein